MWRDKTLFTVKKPPRPRQSRNNRRRMVQAAILDHKLLHDVRPDTPCPHRLNGLVGIRRYHDPVRLQADQQQLRVRRPVGAISDCAVAPVKS